MRAPAVRILGAALLVTLACACEARTDGLIAVKAGRVITMRGLPIDGATVLIQDGKIKQIGPGAAVPDKATVIDAGDSVVMPGLVDANARFGTRGDPNEESDELTPTFHVAGAIDRDSPALKRAVQLGVTTLRIAPGTADVIAGTGVIIKSAAAGLSGTVVRDGGELQIVMGDEPTYGNDIPWYRRPDSFYFRQPTTRMGIVWLLRKAFFDTKTALQAGTPLDARLAGIAAALQGKTPLYVMLRTAVDIETTFTIADEFGLGRLVLVECTEGYKLAATIARRRIPVILGPCYQYPRTWPEASQGWDVNWNNAGLLAKAGVKLAIASNDPDSPANLLTWAALAARAGLPADEALKAVTINPAEIIGVADRVGSLGPGKDADLLVLSGDPLRPTTMIQKVIVNGRIAFDALSGASADG